MLVMGCGSESKNPEQSLPERLQGAEKTINQLKQAIDQNQLTNATLITGYADILASSRPEVKTLVTNLATDATSNGALFKNLQNRLTNLKNSPEMFANPQAQLQEAESIIEAAQPDTYNLALSDVVNVLADLSNGSLPRVTMPSKEDSLRTNGAQDLGAGSQLIGNPSYGQWVNQSNGTSFWEWYGMYALFSNLVDGRRYNYDQWNRSRGWSYYNDVGRKRYGNILTKNKNAPMSQRTNRNIDLGVKRKSYSGLSEQKRRSTYSKKLSSRQPTKSATGSKNAKSFGGNFRQRSSFSRGSFGGK